ncbi:MAG: anti-sigma factor antagonist [Phycisphaerales bacterium]|nr:anti-sigma factor antagonist [Phycisphaerales bacterium]
MAELQHLSTHVTYADITGDTAIFRLKDEIDLHTSPDLRTDILGALTKGEVKKLVLNLEKVPYVDSSAIAVMVEALQKLRKAGGKVYLTNLSPRVKGLLEIARLDSIFSVVANEADVAAS